MNCDKAAEVRILVSESTHPLSPAKHGEENFYYFFFFKLSKCSGILKLLYEPELRSPHKGFLKIKSLTHSTFSPVTQQPRCNMK